MRLVLSIVAPVLLAAAPVQSTDVASPNERLFVGKTNIVCVRQPCPWRGIAPADRLPDGPAGLLWSQQSLPELRADTLDARRIMAVWEGNSCVLVHGRMAGNVLHVEQVIGDCR